MNFDLFLYILCGLIFGAVFIAMHVFLIGMYIQLRKEWKIVDNE